MSELDALTGADRSLADLLGLGGRHAVVTGAGGGIGRRIALRLAEAGATLTLVDLNQEGIEDAAAEIGSRFGTVARTERVDIASPDAVRELARSAAADAGRLDVWVNSAAIFATNAAVDTTDEDWRRVIGVDLDASFYCAREAARQMLAAGRGGVIVQITSLSAHRGRVGRHHYVAAKHGVAGLTKSLAVELGPQGIRVLSVAPSVTETPALALGDNEDGSVDVELERRQLQRAVDNIPLGRIASADEIARVVVFAASDLASFMTGTTLHVDGGAVAT